MFRIQSGYRRKFFIVFLLAAVCLLPLMIGSVGLWLSTPMAEVLALIAALLCFLWWNRNEDRKIEEEAAPEAS